MAEQQFFRCNHCGNLIGMIHSSGVKIQCCGEDMQELKPNTGDGATEKHLPVIIQQGSTVTIKVSDVEHPMTEQHSILWVYIQTEKGGHRINLQPNGKPIAECNLTNEKVLAAYAYCNLHGLWEKKL